MKVIIILSLLIALTVGVLISFFLFTYIKELIALPIVNAGSEDEEEQKKFDFLVKVAFYVSLVINALYLTSCSLTIFI